MHLKKLLIITVLLLAVFIPHTHALAGPNDPPVTVVKLVNPLGGSKENPKGQTDIRVLMGDIIQGAMGIVGSLVLAVFVYGGFLWLTSAGKAEQVKKGTDTMVWAAIGLFLIFGAYAILSLVLEAIGAKGAAAPATPIEAEVPAAGDETVGGDCKLNMASLEVVCGTFTMPDPCGEEKEESVSLCEWDLDAGDCVANVEEMSTLCESKDGPDECEGGNVTGDCEWVEK